jgi:uncharacterized protein
MKKLLLLLLLSLGLTSLANANFEDELNSFESNQNAFDEWLNLAEEGDANAQYNIALMFADAVYYYESVNEISGDDVNGNKKSSFYWSNKSANQGNIEAQFLLGKSYYYGEGILMNPPLGIQYITLSAQQGYAPAQERLGEYFAKGEKVEKSLELAAFWTRKAFENDSIDPYAEERAQRLWEEFKLWEYEELKSININKKTLEMLKEHCEKYPESGVCYIFY